MTPNEAAWLHGQREGVAARRSGARGANRADRRREVEAAVVQGSAHDRAAAAEGSDGQQVLDRSNPAGGDDPAALKPDESPEQLEVRAAEAAVAGDRGDLERSHPVTGQPRERLVHRHPWRAIPPALPDRLSI